MYVMKCYFDYDGVQTYLITKKGTDDGATFRMCPDDLNDPLNTLSSAIEELKRTLDVCNDVYQIWISDPSRVPKPELIPKFDPQRSGPQFALEAPACSVYGERCVYNIDDSDACVHDTWLDEDGIFCEEYTNYEGNLVIRRHTHAAEEFVECIVSD